MERLQVVCSTELRLANLAHTGIYRVGRLRHCVSGALLREGRGLRTVSGTTCRAVDCREDKAGMPRWSVCSRAVPEVGVDNNSGRCRRSRVKPGSLRKRRVWTSVNDSPLSDSVRFGLVPARGWPVGAHGKAAGTSGTGTLGSD